MTEKANDQDLELCDDGFKNASAQNSTEPRSEGEAKQKLFELFPVDSQEDDQYEKEGSPDSRVEMVTAILKQAIPGMFCMVVLQLQQIINLIFVGHMNDAKLLAGVGMGNLIVSVFGISLFIGLNGALETLVSQAYGNRNLQLCGIYLNRGRFMLLLLNIPIVYILCNAEAILLLLKQDVKVAANAQLYIYSYIPALILNGLNDSQRRFLNMVELTRIPLICQLGGTVIHIGFCLLLVRKWEMGIEGIGYASSISNLSVYISLVWYTQITPSIQEAVQMPNARTFQGLYEYLTLGVPLAMMLCLEWWAFEAMVLMSGYIGVDEQATQIILLNIIGLCFFLALGLQQAATSCIGHEIGVGNAEKAKEFYKVSQQVSACFVVGAASILYMFHNYIIRVFTNIESVHEIFGNVIVLAVMAALPDMWQGYLQGVIKALGIQAKVIYFNFTAYWVINLPLMYYLIFKCHWGFEAIWISMNCCQYFLAICFQIMIMITDWDQSCRHSIERQNAELQAVEKWQLEREEKQVSNKQIISDLYVEKC